VRDLLRRPEERLEDQELTQSRFAALMMLNGD
jgi:hypothetical protein